MKRKRYAKSLLRKFNAEMDGLITICPDDLKGQWIEFKKSILLQLDVARDCDIIDIFGGIQENGIEYYKKICFRFSMVPNKICQNIMQNDIIRDMILDMERYEKILSRIVEYEKSKKTDGVEEK